MSEETEILWRNKPHTHQPHNACKGWKHYDYVSQKDAEWFMKNRASFDEHFEYAIARPARAEKALPCPQVETPSEPLPEGKA